MKRDRKESEETEDSQAIQGSRESKVNRVCLAEMDEKDLWVKLA